MPYVVALLVAVTLIGAGALYVRLTVQSIASKMREALRQEKEPRTLPPGDMRRFQIAMLLSDGWYVLAPLTVVACLGVAMLVGRLKSGPPSRPA
jgi:hypothetical protein